MNELAASVEPMIPALRRYARALLRDAALADDLVQDCLERVVAHWQQRRDSADTRQWVFAIAHNLAMDELRRQNRRRMHVALEEVDESELVVPPEDGGLGRRDLLRALDALPTEQRAVLLLVCVEDMSYADVAGTLGIPVGTVMSRLSRGRERLLRLMNAPAVRQPAPSPPALKRLK